MYSGDSVRPVKSKVSIVPFNPCFACLVCGFEDVYEQYLRTAGLLLSTLSEMRTLHA